jgi:hypothetical protein
MNSSRFLLWWDRVIAMTVKELKQLFRDPVLLAIIVYFLPLTFIWQATA